MIIYYDVRGSANDVQWVGAAFKFPAIEKQSHILFGATLRI